MEVSKILVGVFIGFCFLAIIGAPVTAAPNESNGTGNKRMISEGLKNDLWNIHTNYRMQFFQLRVERADAITEILDEHGCDVSSIETVVQQITEQENSLTQALEDRNRQELRQINQELKQLWHGFRKGVKESIRTCREEIE